MRLISLLTGLFLFCSVSSSDIEYNFSSQCQVYHIQNKVDWKFDTVFIVYDTDLNKVFCGNKEYKVITKVKEVFGIVFYTDTDDFLFTGNSVVKYINGEPDNFVIYRKMCPQS